MQRHKLLNKRYTDLSSIISSIFGGRMSPISVHERTIRQLIKMNSEFLFDTIYWEDPLAAYRYATIISAWPLALNRIASATKPQKTIVNSVVLHYFNR